VIMIRGMISQERESRAYERVTKLL
jgi:hypothetical protein